MTVRLAYTPPNLTATEEERLEELYAMRILDTSSDERFDQYTQLAAEIIDVPIALISLVDRNRQWFKSAYGLETRETSRDASFCAHAICGIDEQDLMIVPDAKADPRFAHNPLVEGEPKIRFYAGAVIRGPTGQPLGTCCAIDRRPRRLNAKEVRCLRYLARMIERELQDRIVLHDLREKLKDHALLDTTTGLPNLALFRDRLAQTIRAASPSNRKLALAVIRLNQFDALVSALGRLGSAYLISEIAARVNAALSPDLIGYVREDELALALTQKSQSPDVDMKRLLSCFDKPFSLREHQMLVSVNIGTALYPDDGNDADRLLKQARTALTSTIVSGRSTYQFYKNQLSQEAERYFELQSGLTEALDKGEFHLAYQPKIDISSGRIVGAETLLRWESNKFGPVSPAEFVPIAERSGMILKLGEMVLEQACKQNQAWIEAGLRPTQIAVNVSSLQLRQQDFREQVSQVLQSTGTPASLLNLEITESSLIENIEESIRVMRELCELGITFSIDDFGTGFSSLSYLQKMPLEVLKIDRSFIQNIPERSADMMVAQSIISMAHGLNLKVVAEGVETRAQLAFLRSLHCDEAQGFFFHKPLRADEFASLLATDSES